MLSRESVERAIAQIRKEIRSYQVDGRYLKNFTDAPYDEEMLRFIRGGGGYDYMKFLPLLVKKLGLSNILELGNYAGASTVCIYAGMPSAGAKFATVDVIKDQRYCTDEMRRDPRMRFVIGDVCDLSIYGEKPPLGVDFIFEDTFHFYDHIRDIFDIYQHLLADRALVAIDDINDNDKRKFFDEVPFIKWDLTELCHPGHGWGLILFERKKPVSSQALLLRAHKAAMNVWVRRYAKKAAAMEDLESKKLKTRALDFYRRHKDLHSSVLKAKKALGIIPRGSAAFDEKRFYSGANKEEMKHFRKNIIKDGGK